MLLEQVVKLREAGTGETLPEHQAETCEAVVAVDDDSGSCQIEAMMMFGEEGIEEVALLQC